MDKLSEDILREVRSQPGKRFTHADLSYLQSPSDIKYAMIDLYMKGLVRGEPVYSENPALVGEIEYFKWISSW